MSIVFSILLYTLAGIGLVLSVGILGILAVSWFLKIIDFDPS